MYRIILIFAILSLAGCASQRQLGFSDQQWQQMSPKLQQHLIANYQQIKQQSLVPEKVYAGPRLAVYLLKGEALMPPDFTQAYPFQIKQFEISPGECKTLPLRSIDTDHSTQMQVCYDGVILQMDPSRYELDKSRGTVQFAYNPIWKRGFTYDEVTTTGYARLSHASVSIKALPSV